MRAVGRSDLKPAGPMPGGWAGGANVGIRVEVGQIVSVLLIMALLSLINSFGFDVNRLRKLTGQGVGILAGFWFMERMGGVLQWPV